MSDNFLIVMQKPHEPSIFAVECFVRGFESRDVPLVVHTIAGNRNRFRLYLLLGSSRFDAAFFSQYRCWYFLLYSYLARAASGLNFVLIIFPPF